MKNFLIAFLVFLVWSVFGLWVYSLTAAPNAQQNLDNVSISDINQDPINEIKDTVSTALEKEIIKETPIKKIFIVTSLNDIVIFESDQTITIEKDNPEIILPDTLVNLPTILNEYLQEHPGQELHIKSIYSPSASLQTTNIGEQRGENFKNLLLDLGTNKDQIVVKSTLSIKDFDENNHLDNGMTFTFKLLNRERIANAKAAIPDQIIFYPSYNFDELLANTSLSEFTEKIVAIHNDNPTLHINVVGHTDHIGASSENYIRGLKSSRQIRWYLINKGAIDKNLVHAISKGESEPLLIEGKPASRKENARIEIKFLEKE